MSAPQYHRLTVEEVIAETHDACSLRFAVPEALLDIFAYVPGQHLQLHVPCQDKPLPRCYSLSSNPFAGELLQVTVKRVAEGRASNWICDQVRAGSTLEVAAPAGVFTPKSLDTDFLLFAGGSGITPVISILRSVLDGGRGHIRLIYANRDAESVIFRAALATLAREYADRLEVIHWLDAVQGPPSAPQLRSLARGWERAECFVCGPAAFMDAATEALAAVGVPRRRTHVERFVSLPEDADALAAPAAETEGDVIAVTVHMDGQCHDVDAHAGEPLLDAFEAAGLVAPHSCRSGACGACMCQLESGTVTHRHNVVLDEQDLAEGWILPCQAQPTATRLSIRYPE